MTTKITSFEVIATPVGGEDESLASIITDDHSLWLKFIFTDDAANANAQGIRQEEFDRLIKTGLHKPFKKYPGYGVADDHEGAIPVGAIADLKQEENKVVGIASIWEREFPDDAEYIRNAYAAKEPIGVSWEVFYDGVEIDESGVEWLQNVSTRAITLVGQPAYAGRTPLLAVAAKWTRKYINDLPDSAFLYIEPGGTKDEDGKTKPRDLRHFPYKDADGNIDHAHLVNAIQRIPQAKLPQDVKSRVEKKAQRILAKLKGESSMDEERLKQELEAAQVRIKDLEAKLSEAQASLDELVALKKELEDLRTFKEATEAEKAREALIESRLGQFAEAGIEMTRDNLVAESARWLELDEETFKFVLEAMVNSPTSKSQGQASIQGDAEDPNKGPEALVAEFLEKRGE